MSNLPIRTGQARVYFQNGYLDGLNLDVDTGSMDYQEMEILDVSPTGYYVNWSNTQYFIPIHAVRLVSFREGTAQTRRTA